MYRNVCSALWLVLPLVCLTSVAWGHFAILTLDRPWVKRGEEVTLQFAFGHPFEHELGAARRPARVLVHPPGGGAPTDLSPALVEVGPEEQRAFTATFTPAERGDHLIDLQAAPGHHGGAEIHNWVKLVLHVEPVQRGWDRLLGTPVEVEPLTRPYGLRPGVAFRGRALRDGGPLAGALVQAERYNPTVPASVPAEPLVTFAAKAAADGTFVLTLADPGWWVITFRDEAAAEGPEGARRVLRANLWVHVDAH